MASHRLKAPKSVRIDFKPSPRQYELWKLLQPDCCPLCGGRVEQILIGYDMNRNPQYKPQCVKCHNQNLPQLILGGGAAGGGKSYVGSVWLISSCLRFENLRAVVARKTLKSLKESTWNTIKSIMKDWGLKEDINFKINNLEGTLT
ncbi:phage portal protein, partial [Viscerimonas tarda]